VAVLQLAPAADVKVFECYFCGIVVEKGIPLTIFKNYFEVVENF
jgi:hypothetical protein